MNIFYLFKSALVCLCLFYSGSLVECTISPSERGKKAEIQREIFAVEGPISRNVVEQNFIEEQPLVKSIFENYAAYWQNTSVRSFDGPVLAFVTPVSTEFLWTWWPFRYHMLIVHTILSFDISGTTMATTWRKFSVRNSIKCHRFGFRWFVPKKTRTNWPALMISTIFGWWTYAWLAPRNKKVIIQLKIGLIVVSDWKIYFSFATDHFREI